jgi:hypothetical protein
MGFTGIAVVPGPRRRMLAWDRVLRYFRPDRLWLVGETDWEPYRTPWQRIEHAGLLPDLPLVLITPRGSTSLATYAHPSNAVYLFGSDTSGVGADVFRERAADHAVSIDTDTDDELFSDEAALLVMWSRRAFGG